jgi:hypothetical protein
MELLEPNIHTNIKFIPSRLVKIPHFAQEKTNVKLETILMTRSQNTAMCKVK